MKYNNILETIGNTPTVRLSKLFPNANVWMKLEKTNPGGSIKDRIALAMIEDAEKSGVLTKDTEIIEPTSGNTGIGLAMIAAIKGYNLTLVMPESMSVERRALMTAYGANIVLTPKELGLGGTIAKADEMVANNIDINAQRINAAGVFYWVPNGVPVSNNGARQRGPKSVSDKTGGAIVVWQDYRSGSRDIYAQRIYSGGDITVSVEEENSNSFFLVSSLVLGGAKASPIWVQKGFCKKTSF